MFHAAMRVALLSTIALTACSSPSRRPPSVASFVADPPRVEWQPDRGIVHCHGVDASVQIGRDWAVSAHDPNRVVLVSSLPPSRVVIVTATNDTDRTRTLQNDAALGADWVATMRLVLEPHENPEKAQGSVNLSIEEKSYGFSSEYRLEPDDGHAYDFAYRAILRGSNVCRIAALTSLTGDDGEQTRSARALNDAVASVRSEDLFAPGPARPRSSNAAVDSVCLLDVMLAALNPKHTLPSTCS